MLARAAGPGRLRPEALCSKPPPPFPRQANLFLLLSLVGAGLYGEAKRRDVAPVERRSGKEEGTDAVLLVPRGDGGGGPGGGGLGEGVGSKV